MRLLSKKQDESSSQKRRPVQYEVKRPITAFSYSSVRSKNSTPDIEENKSFASKLTTMWLLKLKSLVASNITISMAAIIVILGIGYSSTLSTSPRINVITRDSFTYRDKKVYADFVSQKLSERPVDMLKLSFDKNALEDALYAKYPEISHILVTLPIVGRKPIVDIETYAPIATLKHGSDWFIICSAGTTVLVDQQVPAINKLISLEDQSGVTVEDSKPILSANELGIIKDFIYQLNAKNITTSKLVLPPIAKELHVFIVGEPFLAKISLADNARMQAGALVSTLTYFKEKGIQPKEYVDVRVEGKVYYK